MYCNATSAAKEKTHMGLTAWEKHDIICFAGLRRDGREVDGAGLENQ